MGTLNRTPRLFAPVAEELGWFDVDGCGTTGMARRVAVKAAERLGFDETRVAEISIALSEVGTNLYKHATQGRLAIRCLRDNTTAAVEIVAIDTGPGMADPVLSSCDGHSTAGTLGLGLGAVIRLASTYDLHSVPGRGTVLTVQFLPRDSAPVAGAPVEGLVQPIAGESVCGDQFSVRAQADGALVMVADGLGHGPLAATASATAAKAFSSTDVREPALIIEHLHRCLKRTRGAAVAVAKLRPAHHTVHFAGVGNIAGFVVAEGIRRGMASLPGIVGSQTRTIREFCYPLEPDAIVVLHSDGLTSRWNIAGYPGLARRSPLVIAGTLLRDAGKRYDDAGVLVAKVD